MPVTATTWSCGSGTRNAAIYSVCPPHWGRKWNVGIKGDGGVDDKWGTWLREVTHERTVRGIARATGRSHTTVHRWIEKGVPPDTVWELTLRFNADPVLALVVLGRVAPEQVSDLNFAAIVRYAPAQVLTAELHARTVRVLTARPEIDPRKTAGEV